MTALLVFLAVVFGALCFVAAIEGTKKPRPYYGRHFGGIYNKTH